MGADDEPEREPDLLLVGVGHVFDLQDRLRDVVHREMPDVVLVELDRRRYAALTQPEGAGQAGGLYGLLGRFQQRAAEALGTEPGQEMLTAVRAAEEVGAQAGLIDVDAQRIFARMWQAMSLKEKLKFVWAALTSVFASKDRIEEEVEQLSGDYSDLMEAFAVQFPSAKEVLIDDRNRVMARRIRAQVEDGPRRVLAVVGDGHVEGMQTMLDDLQPRVLRLRDLLEEDEGNASVGWSVETG